MAIADSGSQRESSDRTQLSRPSHPGLSQPEKRALALCALLVIALTALRCWFAATIELHMDEAYYWTWSKENVLSYLDHPPLIAWGVRVGTALFGDTLFGVRFSGLAGMAAMQMLLGDIVWRMTRDIRSVIVVVLMPEASVYYGVSMTKVVPDTALIPFLLLMVWALLRAEQSGQGRWWILAGIAGGLSLLAKYTAILLVPALLLFLLLPFTTRRWLLTPWPWAAALVALAIFAPVIVWNVQHDWASLRFQFGRLVAEKSLGLRFLWDFIGVQLALVGPILLPVVTIWTVMAARRGWQRRDAFAVLVAACALFPIGYFLWRSLAMRIIDSWPLFLWPFAFAAAAINLSGSRNISPKGMLDRHAFNWAIAALASGILIVVIVSGNYVLGGRSVAGKLDPIGQQAAFAHVAARVSELVESSGATWVAASEYGTWAKLKWYLRRKVPVIQINQRGRYIGWRTPDLTKVEGKLGLFVAIETQDNSALFAKTTARLQTIASIPATWRGMTFAETYTVQELQGWTPELNPPPDSPFYATPNR
jgi:4-amino-4-deoxy-L-arabinose transferase-like glycosyltransferase